MRTPNSELIQQRNEAIFKDWTELCEKQHVRTDYALDQLQQKYFLQKNTIYRIVKSTINRNGF